MNLCRLGDIPKLSKEQIGKSRFHSKSKVGLMKLGGVKFS